MRRTVNFLYTLQNEEIMEVIAIVNVGKTSAMGDNPSEVVSIKTYPDITLDHWDTLAIEEEAIERALMWGC